MTREFPDEWAAFQADGTGELALPLTPDMFPGMSSRRIGAILPAYERANGSAARLVLNGRENLPLSEGTLVTTSSLTIGINGTPPVTFAVDGDKQSLLNVGLVMTYTARIQ